MSDGKIQVVTVTDWDVKYRLTNCSMMAAVDEGDRKTREDKARFTLRR